MDTNNFERQNIDTTNLKAADKYSIWYVLEPSYTNYKDVDCYVLSSQTKKILQCAKIMILKTIWKQKHTAI